MIQKFPQQVGEVLRRARQEAGLTLQEVQRRSRGKFKASAVGSYERGERTISIDRFCGLAQIYGVPADRLLADILNRASPEVRQELTINVPSLSLVREEIARPAAELIHRVKEQRGDYMSEVITLRSGDLEALAFVTRSNPRSLISTLRPAVVGPSDE